MIKWIRKLFGPRKRVYVNDWYYWDDSGGWFAYPVIRLDVQRMIKSERFKQMCRDCAKLKEIRD